jgi:pyrroline-5-carboxylate reductase
MVGVAASSFIPTPVGGGERRIWIAGDFRNRDTLDTIGESAHAVSYTFTWTESDVEASDRVRTGITVRPAEMDDVRDIAGLLGEYAAQGLVRLRGADEIHRAVGEFMVAEEDGHAVGCVALRVHTATLAEVASLAVAAQRNGSGIGGRLVRAAVLRAHARGARRVFAFTFREHLFHQLGFRSVPVTDFPQKLARDYGGYAQAVGHKAAVVLDLESPAASVTLHPSTSIQTNGEIDMSESNGENGTHTIAILGGGNLGRALAMGWTDAGHRSPSQIHITRRNAEKLTYFAEAGFQVGSDNAAAVAASDLIVIAVQPQQISDLLDQIAPMIDPARHSIISVVSGVSIRQIQERLGTSVPIVRAMPNTAVSIGQSMTCLSSHEPGPALTEAQALFDLVGQTLVIAEEMMIPATALCACGIAFFLRAIRAASQGGIEIGFHPEDALLLSAQTARGAASLLLNQGRHPESEIDQVTTPRGCTIAGLNEMEHKGFSSAMIKGILLSASKAEGLYRS